VSLEIAKERVASPNNGIPVKNEVDFFKCLALFYEEGDLCQLEKLLGTYSSIFMCCVHKIYGLNSKEHVVSLRPPVPPPFADTKH